MQQMLHFLSKKHLYLGIARYVLGLGMFPYGLTKIFRTQFVLTGFTWAQSQSIENMPGTTLAWAFLGHSAWFQILLGFLELIPALLLLFRRTTLLGATLMLPVTLNVWLINHALDLWMGTRLISGILLVLNILVLIFEWSKIRTIFLLMIGKGMRFRFTTPEVAINLILITLVGFLASKPLVEYRRERNVLTGDWLNQRPIEWILQKEHRGDSVLADRKLKIYFGPYGMYNESGDGGFQTKVSYTIDTLKRNLTFKFDPNETVNCKYELLGSDGLKITRRLKPAGSPELLQYFRKRVINGNGE